MQEECTRYFHLCGIGLEPESVIVPGNWGRVIRAYGWHHNLSVREKALELARLQADPGLPSRLNAAFVFLTLEEARRFRALEPSFAGHVLYAVALREPSAASFITDWRLAGVCGDFGAWPDLYWAGNPSAPIPGVQWPHGHGAPQHREMLTLSHLVIKERLD